MNLTELSIKRPVAVTVLYATLIALGSLSFFFLSYELVPRFTPPVIAVTTIYPGASPSEVEESVTIPMEDVLSSIGNSKSIRSISRENISIIRIDLKNDKNIDELLIDAQRKIASIRAQLPRDIKEPSISKFDVDAFPILRIGVFSNLDDYQLSKLIEGDIKPKIIEIDGVGSVDMLGTSEKKVLVSIQKEKLELLRISLLQVMQALKSSNIEIPVGKIENDQDQSNIRFSAQFNTISELKDLTVARSYLGDPIRLVDVASINPEFIDKSVISRTNGKSSVGLDILKQPDANSVTMSRQVREKLEQLEKDYSQYNLTFELAQDSSEFTKKAADAVVEDLLLAILLVSLVMLIFLHSIRNSLIVLVSIPASVISTFVVMYLAGFSLNLMTLLGLSLAIGILVDDSIVVIENIYRHLEMGKDRVKASLEGRSEIAFTAISITLIDVVVFFPIIFASGIVADLFRPFSIVILSSTLLSLLVSFTLVPLLTSRFGRLEHLRENLISSRIIRGFENGVNKLSELIISILKWSLKRRVVTLFAALLLLVTSISLIFTGYIGIDFLQAGDRGEFVVEIELPDYATLNQTDSAAKTAEKIIQEYDVVESVFTTVGITSSGRLLLNTNNLAELSVKLVDKTKREISTSKFARKIKNELRSNIAGIEARPVEINLLGTRDDGPVELILSGQDERDLVSFAEKAVQLLDSIPGAVEIRSSAAKQTSEIRIDVNQESIRNLGINEGATAQLLRLAYNGDETSTFYQQDNQYPIKLILDKEDRSNLEDIKSLTVLTKTGSQIPVKQFASIESSISPSSLERTNRQRSITIQSQVIGTTSGNVANKLQEKLEELKSDINYEFTGNIQRQRESFITLGLAFGISVIFVYVVMVILYNSYKYPFVVLFSIPLALIGAIVCLGLSKSTLSIFSILGLIMLVGLVGKNAILVVDFANKLKIEGANTYDALVKAIRLRFRPILMTNISMVIGLLPIALASGAGSEWKNGLAWALIGGLSSSMILSLIIVPVVYSIIDSDKR
ncbi:MAG: efflux RND transporter permease subunit [Bacteroidota bacterium]